MDIKFIVKDSLKYPLSDWKKILILGIIVAISTILIISKSHESLLYTSDITIISFLGIFAFLIHFLVKGYNFRIIKSSLNGVVEPPEFNAWLGMFGDGIKVFVVGTIYIIPAILIILLFTGLYFKSNLLMVIYTILGAGIWNLIAQGGIHHLLNAFAWTWFIAVLYMNIIYPIILLAVTNMANNDSKLSTAFKFSEILSKISTIGWKNLILWYVVTIVIYTILGLLGAVILAVLICLLVITGIPIFDPISRVLLSLIVIPYLYMYLHRSVSLFYMSNKEKIPKEDNKTKIS